MHRSCVKKRIIQHSLYAHQQGSMDFSLGQVVSGFAVEVRRDLAFKMSGMVSEGADVRALQLEVGFRNPLQYSFRRNEVTRQLYWMRYTMALSIKLRSRQCLQISLIINFLNRYCVWRPS